MTPTQEKELIETVRSLMKFAEQQVEGNKLLTKGCVMLERRIQDLEGKRGEPSKIILPFAARN